MHVCVHVYMCVCGVHMCVCGVSMLCAYVVCACVNMWCEYVVCICGDFTVYTRCPHNLSNSSSGISIRYNLSTKMSLGMSSVGLAI